MDIYTLPRVDSEWEAAVYTGSSVLCDDREGWDGGGRGREAQVGEDICIHITDSLCCAAETNTTL